MASSKRELGEKLRAAAAVDNVKEIVRLLDLGADIDTTDEYGWTALIKASQAGKVERVRVLLDKGAQVNMQDIDGWTALMWAYDRGHMDCVKMLLDRGAQVNMQDQWGSFKLLSASLAGEVECVKMLLHGGVQVNVQNENGCTALMMALENVECVKVLVDKGAEVNMQDKDGVAALMKASVAGNVECVKMLLDKGAQVNVQDKWGWTALMKASHAGKVECVTVLLDNGAEVNRQHEDGWTALMRASVAGNMECVKVLLERGAEVNMQHKDGWTALMSASDAGKVECVKVLLDNDAQVNMQHKGHVHDGWTALMWAYDKRHMDCVKVLLNKGAQVNRQDQWGKNELLNAILGGEVECVKVLLDGGVQVNVQNEDGCTALMMALETENVECVKVLLDKGAEVNMQDKHGCTALMKAYDRGHMECVKMLLDRGAQVNRQDKWGETALIRASQAGKLECVQMLLQGGVQVNVQNKDGWTALMMANNWGHVECVKVLLDKGAEVNMQDKDGWTALMMASVAGKVKCVKVLLDKGAQVNVQNKSGDTALHVAVRTKHEVEEKNQTSCIRTLLFHPGIDVNLKNNQGRIAMWDAGYESLRVFNQVLKTCSDFPADSYVKVVLCGNSGAGKSTLTQAIINISKPATTRLVNLLFGSKVIEPLTAGIIPYQVDSSYSNMVIYDLAGHHQYFSSHSACLEAISLDSPAIFLLLQDIRKDPDVISKEVYYWSSMIDGVCHKCPRKSSVLVVGTHVDLLTSEQLTTKLSHLGSIASKAISHQALVDIIAVNLTKIDSGGMILLRDLLNRTNKDVLSMSPPISMMCHLILAFLKKKLPPDMHAISLSDLLVHLEADQDKAINPDITAVVPLLKTLSEKGLIVFIPSKDPHSSWVVLHKESILKVVNGALFAHHSLKEYSPLASNTGIIPTAIIKSTFPKFDVDMITQFMIHFEIGQAVDLSQIITNMAHESSTSSALLYIPALISVDRPSSATVPNNSFRWSETVKFIDQFFTPRFHHVLLYRLPIQFALPAAQTTSIHSHPFNRRCDVWSRGLMWLSETGVATMVEMSESFQSISLTITFTNKTNPKYLELAHSVRKVIKMTRQEFCPHLEVLEVVSCPPIDSSNPSNDTRVELTLLKEALVQKHAHVTDMSGKKVVAIADWEEPCLSYLVGASASVCQVVPALEGIIRDADIARIAGDLPHWQIVASNLGMGQLDIEDIENYNRAPADQRKSFLRKWIWRDGSAATYEKLSEVLGRLNEQGAAEKIRQIAQGK